MKEIDKIDRKIHKLHDKIQALTEKKLSILSEKEILCVCCAHSIPIKDIDLIDIEGYVSPRSENGDYEHVEYGFTCNSCGVRNRILFKLINQEKYFFDVWRTKFKSIIYEERHTHKGPQSNNYYLSDNLEYFIGYETYHELSNSTRRICEVCSGVGCEPQHFGLDTLESQPCYKCDGIGSILLHNNSN